ncbi:hypothetical protein V8C40DRAFT_286889 [Trichoderma camerunense]
MPSSQLSTTKLEKEPLADTAERVRLLLVCCQEITDEEIQSFAADQLLYFNKWITTNGVFAAQHASLDYQLRTAPSSISIIGDDLDAIIECLLATLKGSTGVSDEEIDTFLAVPISHVPSIARNLLLDSAFDSCTRANHLQIVEARINSLRDYSSQIRQRVHRQSLAGISELLDFDNEYVIIRERRDDGVDLGPRVDGFQFNIGKEFEKFVRKALTHKWFHLHSSTEKNLSEKQTSYRQKLLERCVTIISTRRRQLACFRAHYGHEETFALEQEVTRFKPPTSTLVPTSSAASIADCGLGDGRPFDVPPPPKVVGNEEEKPCPYCYLVLPAETFSTQHKAERWEQHLLKDLEPYICLFANCDKPGKTYSSFAEWEKHIVQEPHYNSWECSLPHDNDSCSDASDDEALAFDNLEKLKDHIRFSHPGLDPSSAKDHKRQVDPLPQRCFVCWQVIPELETLLKHIADHLESMSLLALPWRDDITGEEAVASDKAACSVVADDAVGKRLDGIGSCVWEETNEVMTDPAKKLDKHEFASMLLAVDEASQDRMQILEAWIQERVQDMIEDRIQNSYLNAPGWTRAQKHWSGSVIIIKTAIRFSKNTTWQQPRRLKPRDEHDMPWHRNYTVGWICTLQLEFEVSKGMLDYWYRQPSQNNHDPYENHRCISYAYGRIGHHDVVMACLPSDNNATVSVSDVLHDMRESFPFLRLFLVVGIGGGFPCISEGIPWGDDAVGDPAINPGAVIQYDSDRIRREGIFVQTGSLSMLPEDLQTAMRTLKADHQIGHKFSEHLQAALERCEDMGIHYNQPVPETDVQFSIQDDPLGTESNRPQCPKALMELRRARSPESTRYCGPIASGNKITKRRATRDRQTSKNGTNRFQTEAAGPTDGFHCFAIRGISEDVSAHNNDIWQPYAAAMAAEYAKELLHAFPPNPSAAVSADVWYRLTNLLSYTDSMDIEEDSTSTNGNMRIILAPNNAKQLGQYWKLQPRGFKGSWAISTMALPDSVLAIHPGDGTRLHLEPAAFAKGQRWRIIQRGGGVVSICNRSEGYLCFGGYSAELTLSKRCEGDLSQLWRLLPVGIVGQQYSHSDDMVID